MPQRHLRNTAALILAASLYLQSPRRSFGEDRFDFKTLYYQEQGDRVRIIAPSAIVEKELSPNVAIKVEGVYNAISGASPTGAPPYDVVITSTDVVVPGTVTVGPGYGDDDEHEGRGDDEHEGARLASALGRYAMAGATPTVVSAPTTFQVGTTNYVSTSTVPKSQVEDTRVGVNLELIGQYGRNTPSLQLAYSEEQDYTSFSVAVRNAIAFNQKNTTLTLGLATAHDRVQGLAFAGQEDKRTYDAMVGLTQLLDPKTLVTCNLTIGRAEGMLSDPYKIVWVDWLPRWEKRPDTRDKQIAYVSLIRYLEPLRASIEVGYRYYTDTFGIDAHTASLAWYQKLGDQVTVRPAVRYYTQSAADFYAVEFSGTPEFYSSDYRISEFNAVGYGLKVIWQPTDRMAFDAAYERYAQEGQDGVTLQDPYVTSDFILVGCRLWL